MARKKSKWEISHVPLTAHLKIKRKKTEQEELFNLHYSTCYAGIFPWGRRILNGKLPFGSDVGQMKSGDTGLMHK